MVARARSVPRFLPTLTEVVQPSHSAPVVGATVPVIDPQLIARRVRLEVDQALQSHLEAIVANAMRDQVAMIVTRIREQIEPMVRQAVADAVAAELDSADQN